MTKKSFNSLLRFDPDLGKDVEGHVLVEHQRLRPRVQPWNGKDHAEKMALKAEARARLADVWNQTPRAQQWLAVFGGYWRDVRMKHGVGRRPHYNNATELAA